MGKTNMKIWFLGLSIFFGACSYAYSGVGLVQWTTDGVPLCTSANFQYSQTSESDGAGGAIITWIDERSGSKDIYAQRVNSAGVVQWTTNGVAVCTAAGDQYPPTIVSDGAGGAIITWGDNRSGNFDIYAQRVNSAGAIQWTIDGTVICAAAGDQKIPVIVSDGAGGAIITWFDYRNGSADIYAQRVNSAGVVQWTTDGAAICIAAGDQDYPIISSDGSGGAIITWSDQRIGGFWDRDIYAQRVNSAGAVQWTVDGVAICNAASLQSTPTIVNDGAGGAIIAWEDLRNGNFDTYAQRVNSAGVVQWTTDGVAICTASGPQYPPNNIVSDGSGGAIITWEDQRSYSDIYAQQVSSSGIVQWATNGLAICTAADIQSAPTIVSDGVSGAIITWSDWRVGGSSDIYCQRVSTVVPAVTALSPSTGSNLSATSITITGTGFFGGTLSSAVSQVVLDDAANTALSITTVVSDITISASVPAGIAAGSYNVKVTAAGSTNNTSTVKFTVTTAAPAVTILNPSTWSNLTAVNITITGSGFFGGIGSSAVTGIHLDDGANTTLTGITAVSDLTITASVPAGAAVGNYNVKVTTAGGTNLTSTTKFTVTTSAPTVTALSPSTGSNLSSTIVTITGTGFFGGIGSNTVTGVQLDDGANTALTGITTISDTVLGASVLVGVAIGSYNVKVTAAGGTNLTSTTKFTVTTSAPTVTALSPSTGSNLSATSVTITGTGFFGGTGSSAVTGIQLDDGANTALTGVSVVSDSVINASVPAGVAVGSYNVKVTTAGGTNNTATTKFTVITTIDNTRDNIVTFPVTGFGVILDIFIPTGAFGENLTVTATTLSTVPDSGQKNFLETSIGVEITLSNPAKTSTKSITLKFRYNDVDVSGFDESKLTVGCYDETLKRWVVLKTTRDTAGNFLLAITTHFSKYAILQLVSAADLNSVVVYPNPFKPGSGGSYDAAGMTFGGLTAGAKIKIFGISGQMVMELEETDNDGVFLWDAKNSSGENVASGVYFYLITDPAGNKKTGKFAVVR